MKRVTTVLAAIVIVTALAPATADASVKVIAQCGAGGASKRPVNLNFYCGDNGMYATGLSWRSWGGKRAKGFGRITWRICNPDCASGGVKSRSGKVTLYHKVRCRKHRWRYSRLRVKAYHGPTRKVRLQTC